MLDFTFPIYVNKRWISFCKKKVRNSVDKGENGFHDCNETVVFELISESQNNGKEEKCDGQDKNKPDCIFPYNRPYAEELGIFETLKSPDGKIIRPGRSICYTEEVTGINCVGLKSKANQNSKSRKA